MHKRPGPYVQMPQEAQMRQEHLRSPSYSQSQVDYTPGALPYDVNPAPLPQQPPTSLPTPPEMPSDTAVSAPHMTYPSPLAGNPKWAHAHIPPMKVPRCNIEEYTEDWDELPELLRQERRADLTPRRPMNAFFLYMKHRRAQYANTNPDFTTGQLSKILGEEWRALSRVQKAPWKNMHERLMSAFKRKFPNYQYERGGRRRKRGASPERTHLQPSVYTRQPQYPTGMSSTPRFVPYMHHNGYQPPGSVPYYPVQQPYYYDPNVAHQWHHPPQPHFQADSQLRHPHHPFPEITTPEGNTAPPHELTHAPVGFTEGQLATYQTSWAQPPPPAQGPIFTEPMTAPGPSYCTDAEGLPVPWDQYLNQYSTSEN
ncbi:hypothetical protein CspeluHIS016_0701180 [Cutaneotrichosporon spelunceum]|uniref:HMG box domain-containing protein n=1 Tax=Cutaneotrichosporon spelunceum TaxID=1672016 RepID=A0AAD3TYH5_9TREE|nr:hypothetical protein CspeluHIS016_0701180 [Cutaneotrichosporon spelunceum]